jgi:hypothetical protein
MGLIAVRVCKAKIKTLREMSHPKKCNPNLDKLEKFLNAETQGRKALFWLRLCISPPLRLRVKILVHFAGISLLRCYVFP